MIRLAQRLYDGNQRELLPDSATANTHIYHERTHPPTLGGIVREKKTRGPKRSMTHVWRASDIASFCAQQTCNVYAANPTRHADIAHARARSSESDARRAECHCSLALLRFEHFKINNKLM